MVAGNQNVGKSFFCDKILNLCEIRGNHVPMASCSFAGIKMQAYIFGQLHSKRMISRYFYFKSVDALSTPNNLGYFSPIASWSGQPSSLLMIWKKRKLAHFNNLIVCSIRLLGKWGQVKIWWGEEILYFLNFFIFWREGEKRKNITFLWFPITSRRNFQMHLLQATKAMKMNWYIYLSWTSNA